MKRQNTLAAVAALICVLSGSAFAKPEKNDATIAKGKTAYTTNCASCHGDKGDGQGSAGKFLKPPPRNFTNAKEKWKAKKDEAGLFETVSKGLPNTTMVGFGHLSEDDRWAIVYYVQTLMPKK